MPHPKRLFGTIRKLPSGNYKGRYMVDGTYYSTPTTKTKRETQTALDVIHSQIVLGTWTPPEPKRQKRLKNVTTCADLAEPFYLKLDEEDMSPNTKRSYRSTLSAHFLSIFADTEPDKITGEDIQALLDRLKRRYTATTVNNVRRTISTFFNFAKENGLVKANPVTGVKGPSSVKSKRVHKPVALTVPELVRLIDAVPDELRLFFAFGSWCALRYSEIACLNTTDIDVRAWTVTVSKGVKRDVGGELVVGPPKSQAGYRTIAIPKNIRELVKAHLAEFVDDSGLLFHNPRNPYGFYSDRHIRSVLAQALDEVGLPSMRFHDLRHTGLTLYGQAGATLADLMYRAGHTSADTVMIYQQSSLRRDAQLANRMGVGE